MAKSKSSSSSSISVGTSSTKKSLQSPPPSASSSSTTNKTTIKNNLTHKKETRQDSSSSNQRTSARTSSPSEQRQATIIEHPQQQPPPKQPSPTQPQSDESFTQDYLDLDIDIDQLTEELKLQEDVVREKEEEVQFWKQILKTQRENIDKDVQTWTSTLKDATVAHRTRYEEGVRKWNVVLSEGKVQRSERYEGEMKRWQKEFDAAAGSREFKLLREEFKRLEANRYAPTTEMKEASDKLKELEESIGKPSAEMTKAQNMIDTLIAKRDIPTKNLAITSKKEKKYVKNVMKWQNALAEATEKHRNDCDKWEEALADAQSTKKMKRVRRMLQRLLSTSDVPSAGMEQALHMLERLEREEEDAHGIVMRYAGSTVCKLEEELGRFKEELKLTKTLIGRAVDAGDLPNSFDDSTVSGDDDEEEEEEEGSTYGDDECFSWLCGVTDVSVRSGCSGSR